MDGSASTTALLLGAGSSVGLAACPGSPAAPLGLSSGVGTASFHMPNSISTVRCVNVLSKMRSSEMM